MADCASAHECTLELALIIRDTNRITATDAAFTKITNANSTQARALALVGLDPKRL
jgi:hypothetical protein